MAKVLGESGRYVSNEAVRKRGQILLWGCVIIGLCGAIVGFLLSLYFYPAEFPEIVKISSLIVVLLFIWVLWRWGIRKLDTLDKAQNNYRSGAEGENIVGRVLAKFPDSYSIIHDLKTPFGNLDHVVIGPTGVFVLDSKNWRGVVSADGQGELLLNGNPTTKREIRNFTVRLMSVREKVKLLAPGPDPFHTGLFIFTSARIEARWGKTGNVHCLSEIQLHEYIVEKDFGKRLKNEEVNQIARAFLGLAQMDAGFQQLPFAPKIQQPSFATA